MNLKGEQYVVIILNFEKSQTYTNKMYQNVCFKCIVYYKTMIIIHIKVVAQIVIFMSALATKIFYLNLLA